MIGCYYLSYMGMAFGWTQMVPVILTLCLSLLTAATSEPVYFMFGLYLWIPQYVVWVFQYYFQSIRPDPVCQLYQTWAFPSTEAMYIGAIIGFFIAFSYGWEKAQSWSVWLMIYVFGVVPPFILVYVQYNRWWEVAFSMGFGFLSSVMFAVVLRVFIRPNMAYLQAHFPFSTFGYEDGQLICDDHCIRKECFEIGAVLEKFK